MTKQKHKRWTEATTYEVAAFLILCFGVPGDLAEGKWIGAVLTVATACLLICGLRNYARAKAKASVRPTPAVEPTYELVRPDAWTKPAIIHKGTLRSVLALDTRTVNGKEFHTPVFADDATAETVLSALNQKNGIRA